MSSIIYLDYFYNCQSIYSEIYIKMPDTEKENLQLLGGALIVLSLTLLYCWYKKKSDRDSRGRYEGMKTYADKFRSPFEGMLANKITRAQAEAMRSQNVPGVSFNGSMHDLESYTANRHSLPDSLLRADVTGLRWQTEGMENGDMTAFFDGNYDEARAQLQGLPDNSNLDYEAGCVAGASVKKISGDILTPMRPNTGSACASHSLDQLTMTDTAANYGQVGMNWGAPTRDYSVSI